MSKFDDIKKQAADFIEDIKSRFSKKKLSADETSAEFQMESDDKTKEVKVADLNNKRSLYIRVFVVLVIAYLFYDEFMNKNEEVVAPSSKNRIARKKKPKKLAEPQEKQREDTFSEPTVIDTVAENSKEVESIEEPIEIIEPEPIAEIEPTMDKSIPPDFPEEVLSQDDDDQADIASIVAEEVIPLGEQSQNSNSAEEGVASGRIDEQEELIKNLNSRNTEIDLSQRLEITKELEYVSPPSYNRLGRGLVYNCLKKHWACVDQFSYLTCRENNVWNDKENKTSECVIEKVYGSEKDCNTMQLYYINTNKVVEECRS